MKIGLFPFNGDSNKYIDLIKEALLKSNDSVELVELNPSIRHRTKEDYDYVILNWFESLYKQTFFSNFKTFISRLLKFILLKTKKIKVIWVMHNKVPHDARYAYFSKYLIKIFARYSDNIIIHCSETKQVLENFISLEKIEEKVMYVPHPHYIDAYEQDQEESNTNNDVLKLLFIGQIKPYKNVDLLIKVFNELDLKNVTLTLAGKVSDDNYKKEIINLIQNNKNIHTKFKFIADKDIPRLLNQHDLVILPYDLNSSLNSGTIFLAFSNRKTVISPLIGTLKDFENRDMFYSYEYSSISEHMKALTQIIKKAASDFYDNPLIFEEKGTECYKVVKEKNNIKVISTTFRNILKQHI